MTDSPAAPRLSPPSWLDVRLVIGVLLVLVSVVVGARVLASADDSQAVWTTTRDLAPGSTLREADLERREVQLQDSADRYVPAQAGDAAPTGYVLTRGLGSGELLPRAALRGPQQAPELRDVSVPVDPGHLPDDLETGQLVDVYVTVESAPGVGEPAPSTPVAGPSPDPAAPVGAAPPAAGTRIVLRGVPVSGRGDGGERGSDAEAVVLSVSEADSTALVVALRQGTIDLVRVPQDADLGRLPSAAGSELARPESAGADPGTTDP